MEITDRQKHILKSIGGDEQKAEVLAKKVGGGEDSIFDDLHTLTGMGLVDSTDGYYFLTELGVVAAVVEGNEVPDEVEATSQAVIKIEKRGEAAAKYRKGAGIEENAPTGTIAKYLEGIRRKKSAAVSKTVKKQVATCQYDDSPEEEAEPQVLTKAPEPVMEGVRELGNVHSLDIVKLEIVMCPLLGLVPIEFCLDNCKRLKTFAPKDKLIECEAN